MQLLKIYIKETDYDELLEDSDSCRNIGQYFKNKSYSKKSVSKETVISAMKRDQSLIFTTVPEEEIENHSPINIENVIIQTKPLSRPKFLNLRNKTTDVKTVENPVTNTVPITPFLGQTSVCSTPMTELNKVLHQKVMSICVDPKDRNDTSFQKADSLNSVLSAISETSDNSTQNKETLLKSAPYMKVSLNLNSKLHKSLLDLSLETENLLHSPRKRLKSICDPTFPVAASNEKCISKCLYNIYLKEHVASLNQEVDHRISESNTEEWKSLEDFDSDLIGNKNKSVDNDVIKDFKSSQEQKKALTLPLKSFNETVTSPGFRNNKNFGGVQLTPLMSKLSLLANEDRSSGFCSIVTTPSEYKDYVKTTFNTKNCKQNVSECGENNFVNCNLHKAALFVCGQQDMVVILIIEEEGCYDKTIINKLVMFFFFTKLLR